MLILLNRKECVLSHFWGQRQWGSIWFWTFFIFFLSTILSTAGGHVFFGRETGMKKKKKKVPWILKDLEGISGGITCSKIAICSKFVSWLLWNRTFYLRLSSSSNVFFFLCNSATMCVPAAPWVLSPLLLWVSNALEAWTAECTWQTFSSPHTEKCHISQQSFRFTRWSPP